MLALLLPAALFGGGDLDVDLDLDIDIDLDTDASLSSIDFEAPHVNSIDAVASSPAAGEEFSQSDSVLSWLLPRDVPIIVALSIYALIFTVCGYLIQLVAYLLFSGSFPLHFAVPSALIGAWVVGRFLTSQLGRRFLKTHTAAVGPRQLVGLEGEITVGTATPYRSAEVKVIDRHGNPQYIRGRSAIDESLTGRVFVVGYKKDTKEYKLKLLPTR